MPFCSTLDVINYKPSLISFPSFVPPSIFLNFFHEIWIFTNNCILSNYCLTLWTPLWQWVPWINLNCLVILPSYSPIVLLFFNTFLQFHLSIGHTVLFMTVIWFHSMFKGAIWFCSRSFLKNSRVLFTIEFSEKNGDRVWKIKNMLLKMKLKLEQNEKLRMQFLGNLIARKVNQGT